MSEQKISEHPGCFASVIAPMLVLFSFTQRTVGSGMLLVHRLQLSFAMTTEQNRTGSAPAAESAAGRKIVNLALQGGGSHGAFTWGVLDRLLKESWLEFEGITGTSAGA